MVLLSFFISGERIFAFSDVNIESEQGRAIEDLSLQQVLKGYSDGTFKPEQAVTRGQAAKIIATSLNLELDNVKNPKFKDVPVNHVFYKYIAALANEEIISGANGYFNPNGNINHGQIAKIIANGFNLKGSSNLPFKDVQGTGFEPFIEALYANKIALGTSAATFGVHNKVTRGQLATFIHRVQKLQDPNDLNGVWSGTYVANQGETSLTLTIQQGVASFSFGPTKNNPAVPKGAYSALIEYDEKTGIFSLVGNKWYKKPATYEFVDFKGVLTADNTLIGYVVSKLDQKVFTFNLTNDQSQIGAINTDINGEWKGSYNAGQGKTDLTLTIDDGYGEFAFSLLKNKQLIKGLYTLDVKAYEDGYVEMVKKEWIDNSSGYLMISPYGVISKYDWMVGYMDMSSSLPFTVNKE